MFSSLCQSFRLSQPVESSNTVSYLLGVYAYLCANLVAVSYIYLYLYIYVIVNSSHRSNSSLASLTNQIVDRDLDKTSGITCSNWEVDKLSNEQINYAACDAIAGLLIFKNLVLRKINHRRWNSGHLSIENSAITGDDTRGERDDGEHTDEVLEESTADLEMSGSCTTYVHRNQSISEVNILLTDQGISCASGLCQGIIDVTFKGSGNRRSSQMNIDGSFPAGRTSAYSLRQRPLYHNCQIRAPDGTLLSTVDIKKIEWYIHRELGGILLMNSIRYCWVYGKQK